MSNLIFGHSYMKYELNGAYKYTKIHVIELEIPRCSIWFLYNYFSIRKIGISRELNLYFSLAINTFFEDF